MEIKHYDRFRLEEITNLYQSVGWTNYLERISVLEEAYTNSLCVLGAYDDDRLVGIIRAVGDGWTIFFCAGYHRSAGIPEKRKSGQSC